MSGRFANSATAAASGAGQLWGEATADHASTLGARAGQGVADLEDLVPHRVGEPDPARHDEVRRSAAAVLELFAADASPVSRLHFGAADRR